MAEKKPNRFRLSTEERAEVRKRLLERRATLSLTYQLGYYVGEQIVDRFLPTLSCDSLQTRTVISVTAGEGDECKRLESVWFSKRMEHRGDEKEASEATKTEWDALRAYREMLEEKYLPKTIDCHFQVLNITEDNMKEFKEGIGVSLWNCDCSHYSAKPEDIDVKADDDGWFTVITLKRD